jgi:hypothetical protein
MKNLLFLLISVVIVTGISCSPDADEAEQQSINAQNQLVTVKIEVVLDSPIHTPPDGSSTGQNYLGLGALTTTTLDANISGNVGQNTISQTFNMAPSSNLIYGVTYLDWYVIEGQLKGIGLCNQLTLNIYANNELFHTWTKEMGGSMGSSSCSDGHTFNETIIIPE